MDGMLYAISVGFKALSTRNACSLIDFEPSMRQGRILETMVTVATARSDPSDRSVRSFARAAKLSRRWDSCLDVTKDR